VLAGSEVDELFSVLRRLRDEGCAVVLIAHKLAEILAAADRVTVLRLGERVATALRSEVDARMLAGWMMGVRGNGVEPEAAAAGGNVPATGARSGGAALKAADLWVDGDRGEHAIRGVELEIRAGEIFGVGGVDGNGQAELAEALVGLRPIRSGRVTWSGAEFRPGVHPDCGYIPQDRRRSGLAVTMTVEENLLLGAVAERPFRRGPLLRRRALRQAAQGLVRDFDIRIPGLDFPVSSLSGGNQQKIVAARVLRADPPWIVAVNPTRGLDIGATGFVRRQLQRARDRGAAILLISTDLDEIDALADRAAILSAGRLAEYQPGGARGETIGLLLGGLPDVGPLHSPTGEPAL
jgi:simple sugar transport system ATP-binding protein